jgi:hypothetical protein
MPKVVLAMIYDLCIINVWQDLWELELKENVRTVLRFFTSDLFRKGMVLVYFALISVGGFIKENIRCLVRKYGQDIIERSQQLLRNVCGTSIKFVMVRYPPYQRM